MPGIYDEPEYYEAACAYRDVPAEVDALLRWSGKHHEPPRSVLELAAGPAEHARDLARRGLSWAVPSLMVGAMVILPVWFLFYLFRPPGSSSPKQD